MFSLILLLSERMVLPGGLRWTSEWTGDRVSFSLLIFRIFSVGKWIVFRLHRTDLFMTDSEVFILCTQGWVHLTLGVSNSESFLMPRTEFWKLPEVLNRILVDIQNSLSWNIFLESSLPLFGILIGWGQNSVCFRESSMVALLWWYLLGNFFTGEHCWLFLSYIISNQL